MADLLRAPLLEELGFRHGFSLRAGGLPSRPFDSVDASNDRVAVAVGVPAGKLYEVNQVHGAVVRTIVAGDDRARVRAEPADALVTHEAGLAVAVRTADCMPLLMADPASGAVAAVHAGWRGLVAGVLPAAIRSLLEVGGGRVDAIRVAIFPHIRRERFEVGHEVAAQLAAVAHGRCVVDCSQSKPHVDLEMVARAQLDVLGVLPAHLQTLSGCTMSEPERFFSYRRDGARSGRHLTVITAR